MNPLSPTTQVLPRTAPAAPPPMSEQAKVPPAQPSVGKANAWTRDVLGPLLRGASAVPALTGMVEHVARQSEPLPTTEGLVNFQEVVPGVLTRGGLLTAAGLTTLATRVHPSAILNLAAEYPQAKTGEAATARGLGIEAREMAMAPMKTPTLAQAQAFIAQVDAQQAAVSAARAAGKPVPGPLYVHCYAGSDRTGAMVACYRIARQGWPAERAIAEMVKYGANSDMHPDFQAFVRDFAKQANQAQAPLRA